MSLSTMPSLGAILEARGLMPEDVDRLYRLLRVLSAKLSKNRLRRDFYQMHVNVKNIGISMNDDMVSRLNASCGWPAKAVDMLAGRSVVDAFVLDDGSETTDLERILKDNNFSQKYDMAAKSELVHSVVFWTLSRNKIGRSNVSIKLHSAETAAAIWDGVNERIECGMAIIGTKPQTPRSTNEVPSIVNLYTPDNTVVLTLDDDMLHWTASYQPNPMGRPLMEPMAYEPTIKRPFGKSRITRAVMSITMSKLREDMRSEISAEFITSPQKYLLGADDEAFDMDKYEAYIGNIFLASKDEDGDVPQFGQLAQGTMQPHTEYARNLAAQFSGETSIPISSLGVIHDNPASAEAIAACERDMVQLAEHMNQTNGHALRNVMLMAMAINKGAGSKIESLTDAEYSVMPNWHDPSMPNIVAQADAWTKLASAAPWIAETEEFLEGVGIDRAKRVRMLNQKRRVDARSFITADRTDEDGNSLGSDADQLRGIPQQGSGDGAKVRVSGVGGSEGGDGGVVA